MSGSSRQSGGSKKNYEKGAQSAKPRGQALGARPFGRKTRGRRYEHVKTENDLPIVSQVSKFAALVCPYCGEAIKDITGAIASKGTGAPAHFDCVLNLLEQSEPCAENEKIIYIGHGNFAVVLFENPHNPKKFKISRLIEWEDKKAKLEWRMSILDYYDLSKPVF